ncbi:hypothetical protein ES705_36656 [subsurface metagenome]
MVLYAERSISSKYNENWKSSPENHIGGRDRGCRVSAIIHCLERKLGINFNFHEELKIT